MTHSPVLYFRMNDSASPLADSGSGAYPAAITSATFEQAAIPDLGDSSLLFTDFNSYATATGSFAGGITGTHAAYTIGVWLAADPSAVYPGHHIYTHGSGSTGVALRLVLDQSPSRFRFQVLNAGGVEFSLIVGFDNALWAALGAVFVAVVHYPAEDALVMYINGNVAGVYSTTGYESLNYTPAADFVIGGDPGFYDFYEGRMSDLFVVDSALTHEEIQAIYVNSMSPGTPPVYDNFANAQTLTVGTATYTVTDATNELSVDPTEEVVTGVNLVTLTNTVWFKFDPPSTGPWIIIDSDELYKVVFFGPDATPLADRTLSTGAVYAGSDPFAFHTDDLPNPTDVVYVVLGAYFYGGDYFNPDFTFDLTVQSEIPTNDDFANAEVWDVNTAGYGWDTAFLEYATLEAGETAGGNTETVWGTFVAGSTGTLLLTADYSDATGVRIAVWDTTLDPLPLNFGSPTAVDNSSSPSGQGEVSVSVVSGRTYYVQVSATDPVGYVDVYWPDGIV